MMVSEGVDTMSYDNEYSEFWQGYSKDGDDIASLVKRISSMGGNMESLIMDVKQSLEGDIRETYSLISQTADSIKQEVYERIESVEGEVEENYSRIQQNADNISLKVSQTDYNGNKIASLINQSATTVTIQASKINLNGAVTFSDFDTNTRNTINSKTSQSDVTTIINGTVTANYIEAREIARVGKSVTLGTSGDTSLKSIIFTGQNRITSSNNVLTLSAPNINLETNVSILGNRASRAGDTTSSAGIHNHGLQEGDQIMLVGGGYRTWSNAPSHTHNL